MGDFNIDISNGNNHNYLTKICQILKCQQIVTEVTSDPGNLIDMVFSSCSSTSSSTIECTWSEHKIFLTTIPHHTDETSLQTYD